MIEAVRDLDADVRIAKAGSRRAPISAKSLTAVVSLGARIGDELEVSASGPDADAAITALVALADVGFGDGVDAPAVEVPVAASRPPAAGDVLAGVPASPGSCSAPSGISTARRPPHGMTAPPMIRRSSVSGWTLRSSRPLKWLPAIAS